MKTIKYLFLLSLPLLVACGGKNSENASASSDNPENEAIEATTYVVEKVHYADTLAVGVALAQAECDIAYLKSDNSNSPLIESVNKWTRHMLHDAPESVEVGEPLAKRVVKDALNDSREDLVLIDASAGGKDGQFIPDNYGFSYAIEMVELSPRFVTMMFKSYVYTGGAHGGSYCSGQTFSAADGSLLDLDIFKDDATDKVLQLVKKGLMSQHFEIESENDFDKILFDKLQFPSNPPYFTAKGVCFKYQNYEIAPHNFGMPECVIPFETLKPYFTDKAKDLLVDKL